MTHPRQVVRERTKAALAELAVADRTACVYTNRVKDLVPEKLPAIVILTNEERSSRAAKSAPVDRTIQLILGIVIDADTSETIDDDLDAWAEAVEARLTASPPATRCTLIATTLDVPEPEEGEDWLGFLFLEYEATVFGES